MFPTLPGQAPSDPKAPVPPPVAHPVAVLGVAGLAALLGAMTMLGPFAIDTYLPAFPAIMDSLNASSIEVQQTLMVYMLAWSGMTLWHGALSDTFGRRNVILCSLLVFAVGTFGCAASHSVHYLWVFRIMQGVSAGAGAVIGRAIIRDLYEGASAVRLMSMVTMVFSIAPAIAPVLGGMIVTTMGWRAIFLFVLAYTLVLTWFCFRYLPESLPLDQRQPFNPAHLAKSYGAIFRSPLFYMKAGVVAFNFAGLFVYIAAAPAFLPVHLGLGPTQFAWLFAPAVSGIFLGALAANRIAGRLPLGRQIAIGFGFLLGAAVCNVAYHTWMPPTLPYSVAPLFFYTFGMSLVAPGATLLALDLFPGIRGIVASCQSFTVTLTGAVVAGIVAPILSHSVLWLAVGQMAFTGAGLMLWVGSRAWRRRMD